MSEKKSVRDALCDLGLQMCKQSDRYTATAKEHAFKALDGDPKEREEALRFRAKADAYNVAMSQVDEFRLALERGDFKS